MHWTGVHRKMVHSNKFFHFSVSLIFYIFAYFHWLSLYKTSLTASHIIPFKKKSFYRIPSSKHPNMSKNHFAESCGWRSSTPNFRGRSFTSVTQKPLYDVRKRNGSSNPLFVEDQVSVLLPIRTRCYLGLTQHRFNLGFPRNNIDCFTNNHTFERFSYYSRQAKEGTAKTLEHPVIESGGCRPTSGCFSYAAMCH